MFIQRLSLTDFKNYSSAEIPFSEQVNCLLGDNGAGKTNILDSIYYLCLCKSYFNPVDHQNIRHDQDFFRIEGIFSKDSAEETIVCKVQHGKRKEFEHNKVKYDRLSEHIGRYPVVIITPDDKELINGGASERRRFMDSTLAQIDNQYLSDLMSYNKVLSQRNATLKSFGERGIFEEQELEVWDAQMTKLGKYIYDKRKSLYKELFPLIQDYYALISNKNEVSGSEYRSDLADGDFDKLLIDSRQKDRALQRTVVGIHRDDIILSMDGYPLKKFGSQGQKKSFLTALKLAQFDLIQKAKDVKPLLLLDDVFDKLDRKRVKQLMGLIAEDHFGQIIITDTNENRIKEVFSEINAEVRMISLDHGKVL